MEGKLRSLEEAAAGRVVYSITHAEWGQKLISTAGGNMEINEILQRVLQWALDHGIRLVLIVVLALILLRVTTVVIRRVFDRIAKRREEEEEFRKRAQTLKSSVHFAVTITIVVVAIIMSLRELGVDIAPILAAAGILGLAVGFGAQNLVRDLISGFFILMDNQVRVGDVVEVSGKGGLVEDINLRITTLRDLAGNVHYIRNGDIGVITNMTMGYSRYVFEVGVAYREDVEEVIEVLKQVDEELRADPAFAPDIIEPLEVLGLDQFADSAVIIKARTTTKPIQQWRIGREFNLRLKKAFDRRGIEIPFPHLTVYPGEDKQGQSPPLHVVNDAPGARGLRKPE
ncbi:MAG: mechanosensitive ion channel family protein [Spirochaetales bacterium]|nr:mechanosensitive ion channel family protein [Spirochaetales bacterium]